MFYQNIESASSELYRHVSDMAAFSLYVLCERSKNRTEAEIGAIYAGLCDFGGREDIIKDGNAFYREIRADCAEKLDSIEFIA
jgi:hypothetical protein